MVTLNKTKLLLINFFLLLLINSIYSQEDLKNNFEIKCDSIIKGNDTVCFFLQMENHTNETFVMTDLFSVWAHISKSSILTLDSNYKVNKLFFGELHEFDQNLNCDTLNNSDLITLITFDPQKIINFKIRVSSSIIKYFSNVENYLSLNINLALKKDLDTLINKNSKLNLFYKYINPNNNNIEINTNISQLFKVINQKSNPDLLCFFNKFKYFVKYIKISK